MRCRDNLRRHIAPLPGEVTLSISAAGAPTVPSAAVAAGVPRTAVGINAAVDGSGAAIPSAAAIAAPHGSCSVSTDSNDHQSGQAYHEHEKDRGHHVPIIRDRCFELITCNLRVRLCRVLRRR
jgi:putative alpha-1,2-mannosidase